MKAVMKFITLAFLCLIFYSCEQDETTVSTDALQQEIQLWYTNNHIITMDANKHFTGVPDWENYTVVNDKIYIPFIQNSIKRNNKIFEKNAQNSVLTKGMYVLEKVDGQYQEYLHVYISREENVLDSMDMLLQQSYVAFTYSNEGRLAKFYNQKNLSFTPNSDTEVLDTNQKGIACDTTYVFQTVHYSDGTSDRYYLYSFDTCHSSGGSSNGDNYGGGSSGDTSGGGSGGGLGDVLGDNGLEEEGFPDCKSFRFEQIIGKNAISCGVFDLRVTIKLRSSETNDGIPRGFHWTIPDNVYFTYPKTWKEGHAANQISSIISITTQELTGEWIQLGASLTYQEMKDYFFSELIRRVKLTGGEMHMDNRHNVSPVRYETNRWLIGSCAD